MKQIKIVDSIDRFIEKEKLIPDGSKIILGLSGGPDSVFLLHFLVKLRKKKDISIVAAHLDHAWRDNSDKDVEFCQNLCKNLQVKLLAAKISELGLSLNFNGSKEELGRKARRYFLEKTRKKEKADVIALAHHAQDQQETFFIRLIRGSSLSGLTGMKAQQNLYIRPLLETNKKEILSYLHKHNIEYLIDPSNDSPEFLRNRIRSMVIPALVACDKRFDKNFFSTLQHLQQTESFLENLAQKTFGQVSYEENDILKVYIHQLLSLHPVLRTRVILIWLGKEKVPFTPTSPFFDEIIRFLARSGNKNHKLGTSWQINKKNEMAYITK